MENVVKEYAWDVAISLCKQDTDFAQAIVKALNPSLKVFFYENRQQELISKSGPEVFARTFKDQSRVVVILSRKEWSESFYTEIERNAIIDRTALKNQGYQFLMVIPMVPGEIPSWYPSTRIYADPQRFSIEELARFLEFKVSEEGGVLETLTVEDIYQNLLNRIERKKSIIQLQNTDIAIQSASDEFAILKAAFNKKIDFLNKGIVNKTSFYSFYATGSKAHFGYGDYLLECELLLVSDMYYRIVTTQDFCVSFELFKTFGDHENKKSLEKEQRLYYYTPQLKGWALPHLYERATNNELLALFHNRDNSQFYDLTSPVSTSSLVDNWFQKLLSISTQGIERYI